MAEEVTQGRKYALFDRSTGEIIGTYARYDAGTRSYIEQSPEQVREAYRGQLGEVSARPGGCDSDGAGRRTSTTQLLHRC